MSDRHLVVLTTGNILVIFNIVKDVNFPEQVRGERGERRKRKLFLFFFILFYFFFLFSYSYFFSQEINLLKSLSKENAPPFSSTISSFCFSPHSREGGEREDVWSLCTVFFGFRSGEVYSLCPVVPFGVCLPNKLFSFVEEECLYLFFLIFFFFFFLLTFFFYPTDELEPENPLKKNCFLFLEEIRLVIHIYNT